MIAVIQCAATKRCDAGHLRRQDGTKVMFVADPQRRRPIQNACLRAPTTFRIPARAGGRFWYGTTRTPETIRSDCYALLSCIKTPPTAGLWSTLGASKVFILSAGWGLIDASFLTPDYDITFNGRQSKSPLEIPKEGQLRRSLPLACDTAEPVVFFGGKDYVPLFCKLTGGIGSKRTIFYRASKPPEKASKPPEAPGCVLQGFPTASS